MIKQIIDLHIHSKYSRACSKQLELPNIAQACVVKGVNICATSDFTHPLWLKHIKKELEEIDNSGLYRLKNARNTDAQKIKFILSTEISCIYKHNDKVRRIHLLIIAPNIEAVEKFNNELKKCNVNLKSDGRPIMGISAKDILKILLQIDSRFMLIPAHAWTPWFAIFGSKSGYDSLEECFEELSEHVKAIETGLSSDPPMNHCLSMLDNVTLLSNSDAHSLENIGREANVFQFKNEQEITFKEIKKIIELGDSKRFLYTIEFYPEEGKYYLDGHVKCSVCMTPSQTKKAKYICPKCNKKLTVGVLHRVEEIADRKIEEIKKEKFIPYRYIVPLKEIISKVIGVGSKSKKVNLIYSNLIDVLGNEFFILLDCSIEKIRDAIDNKKISLAIEKVREKKIKLAPGYDGLFGTIKL